MNNRDVELLSEYLDGLLDPVELARMEYRLKAEEELRSTLEELRMARDLLRRLPSRNAPRDFRLTRSMVAHRPPIPAAFTMFRFAAVMASLLFLVTLTANSVSFRFAGLAAPPAPAEGLGSGGGGPETFAQEAPAATEAPLAPPALGLVPLPTPTLSAQDNARRMATQEFKNGVRESEVDEKPGYRSLDVWQFSIGLIAILCAVIAFATYVSAYSRWRN